MKKKIKMTTEIGLVIETKQCYKEAEKIAEMKEKVEDLTTSIGNRLADLIGQMRDDKVTSMTAKAPGGSLYKFSVESKDPRVKISKAQEVEAPVFVA